MADVDWEVTESGSIVAEAVSRSFVTPASSLVAIRIEISDTEGGSGRAHQFFVTSDLARLVGRRLMKAADAVDQYRSWERRWRPSRLKLGWTSRHRVSMRGPRRNYMVAAE